jgi:hypothetical protein
VAAYEKGKGKDPFESDSDQDNTKGQEGTSGNQGGNPDNDPDSDDSDNDSHNGRNSRGQHEGRRPIGNWNNDPAFTLNQVRTAPPPKFDPSAKTPIINWLFKMELWFNAAQVTEANKINQAVMLLEGYALTWWMAKVRTGSQARRWIDFKDDITAQFQTIDVSRKAREKLHYLKQYTSVQQYIAEFSELVYQIPTMNLIEQYHHFRIGLKPEIRNEMDRQRIAESLQAIQTAALRYDDMFFNQRYTKRSDFKKNTYRRMDDKRSVQAIEEKKKTITCFKCQKPGHMARECRKGTTTESN